MDLLSFNSLNSDVLTESQDRIVAMSVFGGDYMRNISPLQSLIARAVDPYKHEPDYAAHIEVAQYINQKKANTYVSFSDVRMSAHPTI